MNDSLQNADNASQKADKSATSRSASVNSSLSSSKKPYSSGKSQHFAHSRQHVSRVSRVQDSEFFKKLTHYRDKNDKNNDAQSGIKHTSQPLSQKTSPQNSLKTGPTYSSSSKNPVHSSGFNGSKNSSTPTNNNSVNQKSEENSHQVLSPKNTVSTTGDQANTNNSQDQSQTQIVRPSNEKSNSNSDTNNNSDSQSQVSVCTSKKNKKKKSPSEIKAAHARHKKVMRFIVAPILAVIALMSCIFAGLNATIWRPNPQVNATAQLSQRYIATDPGVLTLGNNNVKVTVQSSKPVCVVVGASSDVVGWIGSQPYSRITGLTTWSQLSTTNSEGKADSAAAQADPSAVKLADSDMWLDAKCGHNTEVLDFTATNDQSILIDTDPQAQANSTQGVPVTVTLSWTRSTTLDVVTPLLLLGILMGVAAILCATIFAKPPHLRARHPHAPHTKRQTVRNEVDALPRWVRTERVKIKRLRGSAHAKSDSGDTKKFSLFGRRPSSVSEHNSTSAKIVDIKPVNMVAKQQNKVATKSTANTGSDINTEIKNDVPEEYMAPETEYDDFFARYAAESQAGADDSDTNPKKSEGKDDE